MIRPRLHVFIRKLGGGPPKSKIRIATCPHCRVLIAYGAMIVVCVVDRKPKSS